MLFKTLHVKETYVGLISHVISICNWCHLHSTGIFLWHEDNVKSTVWKSGILYSMKPNPTSNTAQKTHRSPHIDKGHAIIVRSHVLDDLSGVEKVRSDGSIVAVCRVDVALLHAHHAHVRVRLKPFKISFANACRSRKGQWLLLPYRRMPFAYIKPFTTCSGDGVCQGNTAIVKRHCQAAKCSSWHGAQATTMALPFASQCTRRCVRQRPIFLVDLIIRG